MLEEKRQKETTLRSRRAISRVFIPYQNRSLTGLSFFLLAFSFNIRSVGPLVGLNIHKAAFLIPDGIQFGPRSAAVSSSLGHYFSFLEFGFRALWNFHPTDLGFHSSGPAVPSLIPLYSIPAGAAQAHAVVGANDLILRSAVLRGFSHATRSVQSYRSPQVEVMVELPHPPDVDSVSPPIRRPLHLPQHL